MPSCSSDFLKTIISLLFISPFLGVFFFLCSNPAFKQLFHYHFYFFFFSNVFAEAQLWFVWAFKIQGTFFHSHGFVTSLNSFVKTGLLYQIKTSFIKFILHPSFLSSKTHPFCCRTNMVQNGLAWWRRQFLQLLEPSMFFNIASFIFIFFHSILSVPFVSCC